MNSQPQDEATLARLEAIWGSALQAAATILARGDAAQWGIDDPAGWHASAVPNTARRVVELAAHIILELPDDPAGLQRAKEAAQRWLESRARSAPRSL